MTMMWPLTVEGKPLEVAARWAETTGFAYDAARDGLPAHEMERGLWQYFALAGDGDGGEPPLTPARVGRAAPAVLPSPPRRRAPG